MRRVISTDDAPATMGAYSQSTTVSDLVFTAEQIALTPRGSDPEPDADSTEA
jgi:enamine deaminase RidA (YjgF/YER057c/UK114 family)